MFSDASYDSTDVTIAVLYFSNRLFQQRGHKTVVWIR